MINFFICAYKQLDKKVLHILNIGLTYSFIICLISAFILSIYIFFFTYPILYYIGLLCFISGLNSATSFIISATIIDDLKKQSI